MKRAILVLALCAPLMAGTGCSVLQGQSPAQAAGQVSIDAEKALTIAHLAYNALGTQLIAAANSGVLHGADAAKAKSLYDQAGDALKLADSADKAANQTNLVNAVLQANGLIAQAQTLLVGGH